MTLVFIFLERAHGAADLKPLKKWVVFPFESTDEKLKPATDQAWWNVREKITEKKRFFVASRQFLVEKDVYQPRRTLKPDDVKYLAGHLDADVIITGFSEYRDFTLTAYLAQTGNAMWSKRLGFHPSLKAADQVLAVTQRLISELMDKIPYQGLVISNEGQDQITVDVGNNENLNTGDEISFIKITLPEKADIDSSIDLWNTSVVAIGKVRQSKKSSAAVDVKKLSVNSSDNLYVNILKEKKDASYQNHLVSEMAPTMDEDVGRVNSHSKQTVIFGSVFSFLGILLLAF